MVDALIIPTVDVNGTLTVRPFESGQSVPVIKALPQLTKVAEAIDAIKAVDNIDLLAHWTDYGYATFDQLDAMASIVEARNRFGLVMRTTKWVEQVECLVSDVYNPFRDTLSVTKNEPKGYIEALNLSTNRVPGDVIQGHQLFDFRENLWLHTTSVLVSMMVLRNEYPVVGIINPSYHDFALPGQKRRVAGGLGASDPCYKRVIGIFNVSGHWVAFLIHRTDGVCYMFDPVELDNNCRIIENSVCGAIVDILQVKDADLREGGLVHPKRRQLLWNMVYCDSGTAAE